MEPVLSTEEKRVIAMLGVSPENYAAQKARETAMSVTATEADDGLTSEEHQVIRILGIPVAQYLKARDEAR